MNKIEEKAKNVLECIKSAGGRGYMVGGCVRDMILGLDPKDIDIEVYGIPEAGMDSVLSGIGNVKKAGKSFGVWKVAVDGVDFDISLPRKEVKTGEIKNGTFNSNGID